MKILADENIPLVNEFFQSIGEVVTRPGRTMLNNDALSASALLVRSVTNVNQTLLQSSKVSFVGTCTIGVDHLDQNWLQSNHIEFSSAPGCNANSVVEYVYAALCHLDVNWLDKKFGIIGCGNVGGLLYKRLKLQGVDCYCYDPLRTPEGNSDLTTLEEVLSCDIISMHTPLTKTGDHPSFHLINLPELRQLKSGAVLLNCGRGPVINNADLLQFLHERDDVRVVLDVWEPEPDISLDLLDKVVLGSPHIAGYSYDGKLKGTEMIYQALCKHLKREPELSIKNLVPPLADNQLQPTANQTTWAQVKQLIAQVYSIAEDDQRLRALAQRARAGEENFGIGFDGLRKHYPTRREFHNYQVVGADDKTAEWLRVLGFGVASSAHE
ncbi:erythronate-4-phosphate dehydrogenase [Cellvibrio zantedeschiae]|uniref:Erythronate-4-phosphate dehydrogenase n=1 Tax=Cellvibrio zantedeschiae TaxID=1237077 RepID=A0ABQ3AU77_9GAMM|nr:4-phosphoerythronate dehydrogenase [Cellvibrio zantedeschiae]GGY68016.1 erythronate-4-phosphate dehydrogenase [Cellvibrio zantedeschiae]